MELNSFLVYLILKLDDIVSLCTDIFSVLLVSIFVLLAALVILQMLAMTEADYYEYLNGYYDKDIHKEKINFVLKLIKITFVALAISVILRTILPSTKEMALIYIIPKIAQNQQPQNICTNSLDLIELSIEELIIDKVKN